LNHYAFLSFFSHCTTSFVPWAPFLEANIYVTKYHQNSPFLFYFFLFLQFYIEIWQISIKQANKKIIPVGLNVRPWHLGLQNWNESTDNIQAVLPRGRLG
jgi:hypothetical protein